MPHIVPSSEKRELGLGDWQGFLLVQGEIGHHLDLGTSVRQSQTNHVGALWQYQKLGKGKNRHGPVLKRLPRQRKS